jgi:hypothetical protein
MVRRGIWVAPHCISDLILSSSDGTLNVDSEGYDDWNWEHPRGVAKAALKCVGTEIVSEIEQDHVRVTINVNYVSKDGKGICLQVTSHDGNLKSLKSGQVVRVILQSGAAANFVAMCDTSSTFLIAGIPTPEIECGCIEQFLETLRDHGKKELIECTAMISALTIDRITTRELFYSSLRSASTWPKAIETLIFNNESVPTCAPALSETEIIGLLPYTSDSQFKVFDSVQKGRLVTVVLGPAGTGKTFVLANSLALSPAARQSDRKILVRIQEST